MAMNGMLWGLTAESAIHAGVGQMPAAVDLPVARERATGFPYIPASSLKGALRAAAREDWQEEGAAEQLDRVFGKLDSAGALSVGDARLLLLPVRSLQGSFFWVTCPYALERLGRDAALAGVPLAGLPQAFPDIPQGQALGAKAQTVYLEELSFEVRQEELAVQAAQAVAGLWAHESLRKRCAEGQVLLLGDGEFAYFARYALAVQAHNVLEADTKESTNLWYAETLPPDTLLYLAALPRRQGALAEVAAWLRQRGYLQLGGGETTGLGWCALQLCEGGEA